MWQARGSALILSGKGLHHKLSFQDTPPPTLSFFIDSEDWSNVENAFPLLLEDL